jgi:ribose transport system ATP-binding protein
MQPIIAMEGIVKRFGGTCAVDRVDFDVRSSEVHALLGGNGAGKSTLIKVLAGIHAADAGQILMHGRPVDPQRERLPIAFIHQDLGLIEWMSVAENIALVAGYPRRGGLIRWTDVAAQARRALGVIGCPIDPATRIAELSRTDRSIVAIARALSSEAEVVVLDEPTASLPEAEVSRLFTVLDRLRDEGKGIIYVSHRMDEIFRITDRVTVMRDGARIAMRPTAESTSAELVELIVGHTPAVLATRRAVHRGTPMLAFEDLVTDDAGPASGAVYGGEIVGFAGLRGAGQDSVGRALCGIGTVHAGTRRLKGKEIRPRGPADAVMAGIAFVSSKRQEESLALALAIRENLFINPAVEGRGLLSVLPEPREAELALERLRAVGARPLVTEPAIHTLSGGNQQKVVLARWLGTGCHVLVLEEPTMGVDVGAKADIYALLDHHAAGGGAVIVVSSDLEEIAAICHRALIFDRGRVATELSGAGLSIASLLAHVGGVVPTAAHPQAEPAHG